jgi:hypothetical protein
MPNTPRRCWPRWPRVPCLAETIQQLQAGNEALSADEEFSKVLDKDAAKAYLPAAEQSITRKVV